MLTYSAHHTPFFRVHVDLSHNKSTVNPALNILEALNTLSFTGVEICIVDIDAARGSGSQVDFLKKIALKFPDRFIVSGGISTVEYANKLLDFGFRSVVVGSVFNNSSRINNRAVEEFNAMIPSSRLNVSIDFSGEVIVARGFEQSSDLTVKYYINSLNNCFPKDVAFCVTNSRAALRQSSFVMPETIINIVSTLQPRKLWFGGGIKKEDHVEKVVNSQAGCIVGMSLLEGSEYLSKAIFTDAILHREWLLLCEN